MGGRIVAEVILGTMALDRTSYFNAKGRFAPRSAPFAMGDLIMLAGAFDERGRTRPEDGPEVEVPEMDVVDGAPVGPAA